MLCIYCNKDTNNQNGICDECNNSSNATEMEDIFSSSTKVVQKPEVKKPSITFKEFPKTEGEMPRYAPPRVAAKIKSSKPLLTAVIIAAIIIVVLFLFLVGVFKTAPMKIEKALDNAKYQVAYEVYTAKYDDGNTKALNRVLEERLELIYNEFSLGERSYTSVQPEVEVISKMADDSFKKVYEKYHTKIEAMKKSKDGYEKGVESQTKNNYAFAIECFNKVLKNDSNYADAKKRLELSVMSYKNQALSDASKAISDGNYKEGIEILENALDVLKEDQLVSKRIKEYKKSSSQKSRKDIIDTVDMLVLKEDYLGAIKCIENAMEDNDELKEDKTLKKNLDYYRQKFAEKFEEDIDDIIKRKDYEKAGLLLNQAEDIIPENDIYITKKAELQGKVPIYLDKLEPSEKDDWKQNKGSATDSFGVDRSVEENYFILKSTSTASYYIGGDYETFTASFAANKKIDESVKCKVKITAAVGGEYLYKECEISQDTPSKEISFKVKDCTSLTFSVSGEGANIIMFNAKLNTK